MAEIILQGNTEGIHLLGNHIRRRTDRPGLLVMADMPDFEMRDNRIEPDGPDAIIDHRRDRPE